MRGDNVFVRQETLPLLLHSSLCYAPKLSLHIHMFATHTFKLMLHIQSFAMCTLKLPPHTQVFAMGCVSVANSDQGGNVFLVRGLPIAFHIFVC